MVERLLKLCTFLLICLLPEITVYSFRISQVAEINLANDLGIQLAIGGQCKLRKQVLQVCSKLHDHAYRLGSGIYNRLFGQYG